MGTKALSCSGHCHLPTDVAELKGQSHPAGELGHMMVSTWAVDTPQKLKGQRIMFVFMQFSIFKQQRGDLVGQ